MSFYKFINVVLYNDIINNNVIDNIYINISL
jgi:hypothetical protein